MSDLQVRLKLTKAGTDGDRSEATAVLDDRNCVCDKHVGALVTAAAVGKCKTLIVSLWVHVPKYCQLEMERVAMAGRNGTEDGRCMDLARGGKRPRPLALLLHCGIPSSVAGGQSCPMGACLGGTLILSFTIAAQPAFCSSGARLILPLTSANAQSAEHQPQSLICTAAPRVRSYALYSSLRDFQGKSCNRAMLKPTLLNTQPPS